MHTHRSTDLAASRARPAVFAAGTSCPFPSPGRWRSSGGFDAAVQTRTSGRCPPDGHSRYPKGESRSGSTCSPARPASPTATGRCSAGPGVSGYVTHSDGAGPISIVEPTSLGNDGPFGGAAAKWSRSQVRARIWLAGHARSSAKGGVRPGPGTTPPFRRGCRTNPQAGALGRSKGGVQKAETRCSCVAPAARRRRFQRRQRPSQRVQPRSLQTALCNSLRPQRASAA